MGSCKREEIVTPPSVIIALATECLTDLARQILLQCLDRCTLTKFMKNTGEAFDSFGLAFDDLGGRLLVAETASASSILLGFLVFLFPIQVVLGFVDKLDYLGSGRCEHNAVCIIFTCGRASIRFRTYGYLAVLEGRFQWACFGTGSLDTNQYVQGLTIQKLRHLDGKSPRSFLSVETTEVLDMCSLCDCLQLERAWGLGHGQDIGSGVHKDGSDKRAVRNKTKMPPAFDSNVAEKFAVQIVSKPEG
mmetsp:Transcript_5811/g.12905  ORF Transcript_5811/g.12905 Transcript_5811/m.12905 type:complete len:247 (-) Transcript_5811:1253-1993(-)